MRAAFIFAVVALTSSALGDEPSTPLGLEAIQSDPPRTSTGFTQPPAQAPAAASARAKTTISLTANSVIIGYGDDQPSLHVAPGAKAVIICDSFNAESAPGERPTLHCRQCEFTLPNGSTGEAPDLTYDTTTKLLTLTGTDDQPVKLASNRDGGGQRIKAPKMEVELDFSAKAGFPIPTRAYIEAGDPFAPATTITPNPIHRTDKALIAD